MLLGIVVDGRWRQRQSAEFRARLLELRNTIQARYAAELAVAGLFRRLVLRWRIALEFRKARRNLEPSARALFFGQP